jgi:hypothetical protein
VESCKEGGSDQSGCHPSVTLLILSRNCAQNFLCSLAQEVLQEMLLHKRPAQVGSKMNPADRLILSKGKTKREQERATQGCYHPEPSCCLGEVVQPQTHGSSAVSVNNMTSKHNDEGKSVCDQGGYGMVVVELCRPEVPENQGREET